jgi:ribose transport system permease protein
MTIPQSRTDANRTAPAGFSAGHLLSVLSIPLSIVVLMVLGSIVSPSFLTIRNLINILNAYSAVGLAALGTTFVAVCGGLADLSIPANVAMGALVALGAEPLVGPVLAALLGILVACLGGLINGILIGYMRINPIIVTLGTGFLLLGLAQLFVGGGIVYAGESGFRSFVAGNLLGVPVFVWIFFVVALILHVVLSRTAFGRWNFAVGGNYDASAASAVPVRLTRAAAFVLTGMLSGMCGVMIALSIGQARPIIGAGYEFVAITAVVIGGTSLFGGRGSILRTVGGVIILALISNLIVLIGWPTPATGLATGTILLVVVAIDAYLRRRTGAQR